MIRTWALRVVAVLNALCAVGTGVLGAQFLAASGQQENAGVGSMALVLFVVCGIALAVAVWTFRLAARPSQPWVNIAALVAGLLLPVIVAPVALDAFERSTTTLTIVCSNLAGNDPQREAAIAFTTLTYFSLMNPWFAHEPDTRYVVNGRVFRMKCKRHGACEMRDDTEQQLREAVAQLPNCVSR